MDYRKNVTLLVMTVALWALVSASPVCAQDRFADQATRQMAIEMSEFIQIPGPNPIIRTGRQGAWDSEMTEASDAFEDLGTYYFYYHAIGKNTDAGYQLGVASSASPLGPFKKYGDKPILAVGPKGSWDDSSVACAMVVKEGDEKYYMWYSGIGSGLEVEEWTIGLATAESPLGPWKKYEENPVLLDFGYVGGVIKHDGKYQIFSAHPISWEGYNGDYYKGDYSPLAVAVADKPEGPYVKHTGNPLMVKGAPGDWDDGGISEAEVLFHNGMYHMFYGGTRIYGPRLESIGYAYSFDGFKWFKYGKNPVLARQANPNAAAFAEVHSIIELPFIYVYHTLRPEEHNGRSYPWVEDLGVQVLVTQKPFSIDMPALNLEKLAGGATTKLDDAPPICLSNITQLSITAECKYGKEAKKPIRVHVLASYDGVKYDTADLYTLDNVLQPGKLARKTFQLDSKVRFIKVMVENLDESESVSDVKIIATLGG